MNLIDRDSDLWNYLTPELRGLIEDGERLFKHTDEAKERVAVSDFSFLVFPFAKAYEGFMKKLFLDTDVITHEDYYGDEIRIGRLLNPSYIAEHRGRYKGLRDHSVEKKDFARELWNMWKEGRNLVFHYFPHNFRKLSYEDALEIVMGFVGVMEEAVKRFGVVGGGEMVREEVEKINSLVE
jgi:hypothetical protein